MTRLFSLLSRSLAAALALAAAAPAVADFHAGPWPRAWEENGLTFL